jgi:hypothetical protein
MAEGVTSAGLNNLLKRRIHLTRTSPFLFICFKNESGEDGREIFAIQKEDD